MKVIEVVLLLSMIGIAFISLITLQKLLSLEQHDRTEASRFEKYLEKWERENYQREQWLKNYNL